MKKLLFALIYISFITTVCQAQPIQYSWAQDFGGKANYANRMDMVRSGTNRIYVIGEFTDSRTFGSFTLNALGFNDVFIAAYDTSGTCLWAKQAGAQFALAYSGGIAADNSGNVYITGYFISQIQIDAFSQLSTGASDIFIAKLDNNGNAAWLSTAGSSSNDEGISISCANNNLYLTGYFTGNAAFGTNNLSSSSTIDKDIFLAKYDLNGNCTWAYKAGGTGEDRGLSVKKDNSNNIILCGSFNGTAMFGTNQVVSSGSGDAFIAKYTDTGTNTWVSKGGGTGNDNAYSLGIDQTDNYYITGDIGNNATFGTFSVTDNGYGNAVIAKYNSSGVCQWAKAGGSSTTDAAYDIYTFPNGGSYIIGYFSGAASFSGQNISTTGFYDVFIVKYDASGNVAFATSLGGSNYDVGKSIVGDPAGFFFVAGDYSISMSVGSTTLTCPAGTWNTFLAKLNGGTVGLNEITTGSLTFSCYPNPASEWIGFHIPELAFKNVTTQIFDQDGKLIQTDKPAPDARGEVQLFLNGLRKGNYYIRVTHDQKTFKGGFTVAN